jgi:hypothetical protein
MAVWLNGPFGVGKSTVSEALVRRIPDAVLADPERIGWVVRRTFWRGRDYQEVALWRRLTIRMVERADARGTAVVPMTIVEPDVFEQITRGARVFALVADRPTIEARIASDPNDQRWRSDNLDRCLDAFRDDAFGERIATDGLSAEAVADEVLRRL